MDLNNAKERRKYLLSYLLEKDIYISIDDIAQKLSISKGTTRKDLQQCREIVEKYNIHIVAKQKKGIHLVGNEENIRLLIINYLYKQYVNDSFQLDTNTDKEIQYLINNNEMNSYYQNLFYKVVTVSIKRMLLGCYITYENKKVMQFQKENKLSTVIEKTYHVSMRKRDIEFIMYPLLFTQKNIYQLYDLNQRFILDIYALISKVIYNRFMITIPYQELFDEIKFHLTAMIIRSFYKVEDETFFFIDTSKTATLSFEIAKAAVEALEEELEIDINILEIYCLSYYFDLYGLHHNHQNKRKIAVICKEGNIMTKIIVNKIDLVFHNKINIDSFTGFEEINNVNRYFCIFTTNQLPQNEKNVQVSLITHNIEENKIIAMYKLEAFNRILRQEEVCTKILEIKENNYFEQIKELNSYSGLFDQEFIDGVIKKERVSNFSLSETIFVPHGTIAEKIIKLAIGIHKKQGGDIMRIIYLIGIPKQMNTVQEQIVIELYDLLFDQSICQDISNVLKQKIDYERGEE